MSVPPQAPHPPWIPQQPPQQGQPSEALREYVYGAAGQPRPGDQPHGYPQAGREQQSYPQGYPQVVPVGPQQAGQPPKKKRGVLGGVLGGAGVVLTGLLFVVGRSFAGAGDGTPEVGECVAITDDSGENVEYETTGCGTTASDHKVAQVRQNYTSCGNDHYSEITQGSTRLCLIPDVTVGDCQQVPGATSGGVSVPTGIDTKVPCGDPAADVKIVTSVRAGIGESACPADTENYSAFNDPPKTICLKWLR